MILKLWVKIYLCAAITSFAASKDFWENKFYNCGEIKQKLADNVTISRESDIVICIHACFEATVDTSYEITPDQCFSDLVEPYFINYLQKEMPTNTEIQECLNAENRSNCEDVLLYFFTKWHKDHYTSDYLKRFVEFLFNTWIHNPDIKSPIGHQDWDHTVGRTLSKMKFDSDEHVEEAIKVTSLSDPIQFPVIHNEIKRHCFKAVSDADTIIFCRLRVIMNIANKIRTLAKGKHEYHLNFDKYVEAIKSNFVPFSILFDTNRARDIAPSTNDEKTLVLDEQLAELATLTQAGSTRGMQTFLQFMPEPYLLQKACKRTENFPTVARRCCIVVKVVEQLLIYSEMAEKRKVNTNIKAVTINFSLNLRVIISELRGEEVFKMMLDNRYQSVTNQEETASLIEGKFDQLKHYFSKLQSFNMQKARADVDFVKGRIKYYEDKSQKAINDVSKYVGGILKAALIIQSLEVAEKAIQLTFAIAEACNPFKSVFNGGTASDILGALGELSNAIADLVGAIAVKEAWENVLKTITTINEGFQKNTEFLTAVGRIVDKVKLTDFPDDDEFEQSKSTFLRLYNAYTPQIDKQMLEDLASEFDATVSSGCEYINEASGAAGNTYVACIKHNLYCEKAAVSTNSLKTIFEEIYDFQFEFIESMAEYLRSSTGYHASKQMVTLTGKPMVQTGDENKRRSELRANIIIAHTTYEMQKQGAIQSLCDFLEYKEGGITPAVCEGSTTDVPTLLSYIPRRCRLVTNYVSIPTTIETKVPPGHINIKRLYAGEEVSFDVPNYDWIKDHKWIGQDDEFKAIYIRNFQVFLPTINQGRKRIEVRVRSVGGNRFQNGGTKYSLIPAGSFTFDYTGDKRFFPCSGRRLENPYSICEDRKLPTLCVTSNVPTSDDTSRLRPTMFARFKIKAKGITASQTPEPKTPLDIKAKINMCVFDAELVGEKRSNVQQKAGCCSGNNYWNEAQNSCQPCEDGSSSNLNGYYCEKNQEAILEKTKEKRFLAEKNVLCL